MPGGLLIYLLFLALNSNAQDSSSNFSNQGPVYKLKGSVDIPVFAIAGGWSGYALTKIYSKDTSSLAKILSLRKEDVNGFDRRAIDQYHLKARNMADILFYGSMPLPLLLFLDNDIRKDAGKILFLYLEAMSIHGLLYTGSVYLIDRYRPYTYNPAVPMSERKRGGGKNSFFAGHVGLVGTSTFFIAKVYSDYHPDSKLKYLLYGAAIVATGSTAYLRYRGGQHFPSDILLGLTVGTLTGILVPQFHKNKSNKNSNLSFTPFTGSGPGFGLVYTIK
jgi:membrane-associated phospholipid phosphatase